MLQRHVRALPRAAATSRAAVAAAVRQQLATMASSTTSKTPMEDAIRTKITEALRPSRLEIANDSHKHAHHAPMAGSTSKETHFRLVITSDAFASKMQRSRHRLVYDLLKDEMAQEGGIHALQLRTMTPDEELRSQQREQEQEQEQSATNTAEAR